VRGRDGKAGELEGELGLLYWLLGVEAPEYT